MEQITQHTQQANNPLELFLAGLCPMLHKLYKSISLQHILIFVEIIRNLDSFVITALEGECDFCFLGEALACDYRIASQDAVFVNNLFQSKTMPGVLPWFLTRFLGQAAAADILLEGRSLTASEAYELKLVNKIATPGNLEQVSLNTARRFAAIPGPALRAVKRSLVASAEDLNVYLDKIGTGFQFVQRPHTNEIW